MNNVLREIESEEVVVYRSHVYSQEVLAKCRALHAELVKEGKLSGAFESDRWVGYSGVKRYGVEFSVDSAAYRTHAGREFGISPGTMKNMLRCYAVYCTGVYVYQTISRDKLGVIKEFLQRFGDRGYSLTVYGASTVEDFLGFIGTPDRQIRAVLSRIALIKENRPGQRTLSPVINYLAIENEINRIYRKDPDEETFRRWFPVYFWVNITFILPLRATEMLVTPMECIRRTADGRVLLTVRRTKLKKGRRTVYYDVEKDYTESTYEIPDAAVAAAIEEYQRMTAGQDRRFLFEYSALMVNEMFSLNAFNHLLEAFMRECIIGNPRYEFAKYAAGISEFEVVSAGDSRPIAMANLYFQNAGEDICRQLADHVHINTSSGYYTNISETIWASSVIRLQRRMDYGERYAREQYRRGELSSIPSGESCTSERRLADREDLYDCIKEGHLEDCMGCRYYRPSAKELAEFMEAQKKRADEGAKRVIGFMNNTMKAKGQDVSMEDCMGCRYYRPSAKELAEFMEAQKKRADEGAKRVIGFMNNTMKAKGQDVSMEELFLAVQTDACRYRMGCEIYAKEKYEEWQGRRNIRKNCF